jgi:hypothetical protein
LKLSWLSHRTWQGTVFCQARPVGRKGRLSNLNGMISFSIFLVQVKLGV